MSTGLTIGSLFSGIGGLELGLERAGLGPVKWQAESDPFAREILARHWPEARRYEDVRDVDRDAARVDVVCGGFPCQDLSLAGNGAGLEGERSGLWTELVRVARVVGCRYLVVENVSALLVRGLGTVLGALSEGGFDAAWDCVPAAAVGAPHRRDRIFLLAWRVPDAERDAVRQLAERGEGAARAADAGDAKPRLVGYGADGSDGPGPGRRAVASCASWPSMRERSQHDAEAARDAGAPAFEQLVGDAAGARRQGRPEPSERGQEREPLARARGEALADADRDGREPVGQAEGRSVRDARGLAGAPGGGVADAGGDRLQGWREAEAARRAGDLLADPDRWRLEIERVAHRQPGEPGAPWRVVDGRRLPLWPPGSDDLDGWARVPAAAQPAVRRVADGVRGRVDRARRKRLKALGNAVVPAVAEVVGRLIAAAEQERLRALEELASVELREAV